MPWQRVLCKGVMWLLLMGGCGLTACMNNHQIYVSELSGDGWSENEPVALSIENTDTLSKRNIYVLVRFSGDFSYTRLGLSITTTSPIGRVWCDTIYIDAFEKTPYLGLATDRELLYRSDVTWSERGRYSVLFRPVMPREETTSRVKLEGVMAVGVHIKE